jgi:hypothetical protein
MGDTDHESAHSGEASGEDGPAARLPSEREAEEDADTSEKKMAELQERVEEAAEKLSRVQGPGAEAGPAENEPDETR